MRVIPNFINIFFLLGATLLLIFIVLSGSSNVSPLNKFYWLEADTSDIPNAYTSSSWTFWGVCNTNNFTQCLMGPSYPLSPVDNFQTDTNVPSDFIANRSTYFYLTRFVFAFSLLSLGFTAISLFTSVFAICSPHIQTLNALFISLALIFITAVAAMQTSAVVLAKNAFHDDGKSAKIGAKMLGITWASFVLLLIIFINATWTSISNSYRTYRESTKSEQTGHYPTSSGDNDVSSFTREDQPEKETSAGIRFFKIKRTPKTIDDEESV